jgi:hypothetical protein
MSTAAQIREKALRKLGVKATGQTTQAEIAADLDNAYTEVYAMLSSLGLTTWDSDEDIPDEFVAPVVSLVAFARVDEYSIPNDRFQRIDLDANGNGSPGHLGAISAIKELQASNVYKTPTADYF